MNSGWAVVAALVVVAAAGSVDGSLSHQDAVPAIADGEQPTQWRAACAASCSQTLLVSQAQAQLVVAIAWDPTTNPGMQLVLETPGGDWIVAATTDRAAVARLADAPAGTYILHIQGHGTYNASASGGGDDLVPNLVTLIPTSVRVRSCSSYEREEQGARRCLRLSNGVGNIGRGPLDVRLELAEGAKALASSAGEIAENVADLPPGSLDVAGTGQFVQRIFNATGGYRDEPVAGAEFHPTHAHFHYAGLAGFELYEFDQETGLRGDPVTANKKSGFCFLDWDRIPNSPVPYGSYEYGYTECLVPGSRIPGSLIPDGRLPDPTAWRMGVSVGWYDLYTWDLDEQYVEISGVPDGVYELVSTADVEETLEEEVEVDNTASVVLRLTGSSVQILEERGIYRV